MAILTENLKKNFDKLKANVEGILGITAIRYDVSALPLEYYLARAYLKDNEHALKYQHELSIKNNKKLERSADRPQLKEVIEPTKLLNIAKLCRLAFSLSRQFINNIIDNQWPGSMAASSEKAILFKSLVNLVFVPFEAPLKIVELAIDRGFSLAKAGIDMLQKWIIPKLATDKPADQLFDTDRTTVNNVDQPIPPTEKLENSLDKLKQQAIDELKVKLAQRTESSDTQPSITVKSEQGQSSAKPAEPLFDTDKATVKTVDEQKQQVIDELKVKLAQRTGSSDTQPVEPMQGQSSSTNNHSYKNPPVKGIQNVSSFVNQVTTKINVDNDARDRPSPS